LWCGRPARTRSHPKSSRFFRWIVRVAVADRIERVGDWRRNHIATACPFSQVNGATTVAAEREFRVRAFHGFLADRTAEFESALARHYTLYFSGKRLYSQ